MLRGGAETEVKKGGACEWTVIVRERDQSGVRDRVIFGRSEM